MSFDKDDGRPLINVHKWGTKVNFGVVMAVVIFLVAGIFAVAWVRSHGDQVTSDMHQKME
jgi:hypothetical protein